MALGTFSTTSTAGTASCPVSSAGSVMTANCTG
ncbi:thiocillin family RiPP [Kitasatospora sp. NPDC058492]